MNPIIGLFIVLAIYGFFMKVIHDAYKYELPNFEAKDQKGQIIKFFKKESVEGLTEMHGAHDGTTNEEVIEVLIHRLQTLQKKLPCKENACAITHLEEALLWLNERERKQQLQRTTDMQD